MSHENSDQESEISKFSQGYKPLFKDRRLYEGFQGCLWGIISSGSCKVSKIAASNPVTGDVTYGERRLRRLLHGENERAQVDADSVGKIFSQEGAKRLKGEHEVLLIIDESDLRKPHGSAFEHLDTVRDLDGKLIPGFHTLNIIGIGLGGERALLYHKSFSSKAPGFKSMNIEYKTAMTQVRKALREQGVGRLLWVMDRGFDDAKLMKQIHQAGDCFVLRSQYPERNVRTELGGRQKKLRACLDASKPVGKVDLEQRLFKQTRNKTPYKMSAHAISIQLDALPGTALTAIQLSHPKVKHPWLLLSNLQLDKSKTKQLELATRIVQAYRQRWAIEDLFAWTKGALEWESVRLLNYQALRTLVMFAWLAASFLFALGTAFEQAEIQLLASLGGWVKSKKPPGKATFTQGLAILSHHLLVEELKRDPQKAKELEALSSRLFPA